MPTYDRHVGDYGQTHTITATLNFDTATAIVVRLRRPDGSAVEWTLAAGTVTVLSATQVRVTWRSSPLDLNQAGSYAGEVTATQATPAVTTSDAFTVSVGPRV